MSKSVFLALIGSTLFMVGCANEPDEYAVESWEPVTEKAFVYCAQQEYEITRMMVDGRRQAFCVVSEQESYEIQEFYNMRHKRK